MLAVEPTAWGRKGREMKQGHCLAQHASTQANKHRPSAHRVVDPSFLLQEELILTVVIV